MGFIKGTSTEKNLIKAYCREMQVSNKYKLFAQVAEQEGYIEIAELFDSIAKEEFAHAKRFYEILIMEFQGVKIKAEVEFVIELYQNTADNLKAALLGENEVWRVLYPRFAKEAEDEGLNHISYLFNIFAKSEKLHEDLFIKYYNDLKNDRYYKKNQVVKWICSNCGIIMEAMEAPEICPGCLVGKGYFKCL